MIYTQFGVPVKIIAQDGDMARVASDGGWGAWRHISHLKADNGLEEVQAAMKIAPKGDSAKVVSKTKQRAIDELNK